MVFMMTRQEREGRSGEQLMFRKEGREGGRVQLGLLKAYGHEQNKLNVAVPLEIIEKAETATCQQSLHLCLRPALMEGNYLAPVEFPSEPWSSIVPEQLSYSKQERNELEGPHDIPTISYQVMTYGSVVGPCEGCTSNNVLGMVKPILGNMSSPLRGGEFRTHAK
ncbi:unnamed protein product [Pleuronectes platessa]|uniref:Uncharacterized protein n=1 Tax=Pleuronectes platessa TaxID=8262 RepID=A0A9N7TG61_PLEPL|nr:unnamed protein product [Pleuronectes platessa]